MDQQDQRMECLRMAIELGGKAEPIVSAAQQLLDFVSGTQHPAIAASTELVSVEAAEPRPGPADAPEAVATDAIAACGTALVMPEGVIYADAMPSVEAAEGLAATPEVSTHAQTHAEVATAVSVCEPASAGAPAKPSTNEAQTSEPPAVAAQQTDIDVTSCEPLTTSELPCERIPSKARNLAPRMSRALPLRSHKRRRLLQVPLMARTQKWLRRLRKPKHAKPVRTAGLCY